MLKLTISVCTCVGKHVNAFRIISTLTWPKFDVDFWNSQNGFYQMDKQVFKGYILVISSTAATHQRSLRMTSSKQKCYISLL